MGYLILSLFILVIYFIPSWNAYENKSSNFNQILILNIFLGWTLIGWVGALIWSMQKNVNTPAPQNFSTVPSTQYKTCPFCAETILLKANKCRFCGEFLKEEEIEDVKVPEVVVEKKESFEERMAKIDGLIDKLKK